MWVIKDGDNNICGYFLTKEDAVNTIKTFGKHAVCEKQGTIYTFIEGQRWWYSLRVEELITGKMIRLPAMENYAGMIQECNIEIQDLQRIKNDLTALNYHNIEPSLLWHPDTLRAVYKDNNIELPKWYTQKYRQYLL